MTGKLKVAGNLAKLMMHQAAINAVVGRGQRPGDRVLVTQPWVGTGVQHRYQPRVRLFLALDGAFRLAPALKAGALEAATWMVAPVWGLRPMRAARSLTSKVPKPGSVTLSPRCRVLVMAQSTASTDEPAAALFEPVASATASTNSLLFTIVPPWDRELPAVI